MNLLYVVGALLMVIILGYAYVIFIKANKEKGPTRITGFVLSGLLVGLLLLLIVLYKTGVVGMPSFMPERPSARMMQGMSGYMVGMMSDDPRTVDEFVLALKVKPDIYNQLREKLK